MAESMWEVVRMLASLMKNDKENKDAESEDDEAMEQFYPEAKKFQIPSEPPPYSLSSSPITLVSLRSGAVLDADPNSFLGKSTLLLKYYEKNKYYQLIVYHDDLERFLSLCNRDLIRFTEFYCFCGSVPKKNSNDESVDKKQLHLHALTYIPNAKNFRKEVWNHLSAPANRCITIKDYYDLRSKIIYVSRPVDCKD
jgi:hypothetical protein